MPKPAFPAAGEAMPTVFLTVRPSLRASLANTIDSLIALLDEIDGDENLEEPGDDEPTLGWPAQGLHCLRKGVVHDDRELEDEHDEDGDTGIADHDALHEVFAS